MPLVPELPTWLQPDPPALRQAASLAPHQIVATWEDTELEAHIVTTWKEQGLPALAKARRAAGRLVFPSRDADLQIAYPADVLVRVVVESDATCSEARTAEDDARDAATELTWPFPVRPKFVLVRSDFETATELEQDTIDESEDAATADRAARILEQKETLRSAVEALVKSKLWYTQPGEDNQAIAKNHYMTAMKLLSALDNTLEDVLSRYTQEVEDPFA